MATPFARRRFKNKTPSRVARYPTTPSVRAAQKKAERSSSSSQAPTSYIDPVSKKKITPVSVTRPTRGGGTITINKNGRVIERNARGTIIGKRVISKSKASKVIAGESASIRKEVIETRAERMKRDAEKREEISRSQQRVKQLRAAVRTDKTRADEQDFKMRENEKRIGFNRETRIAAIREKQELARRAGKDISYKTLGDFIDTKGRLVKTIALILPPKIRKKINNLVKKELLFKKNLSNRYVRPLKNKAKDKVINIIKKTTGNKKIKSAAQTDEEFFRQKRAVENQVKRKYEGLANKEIKKEEKNYNAQVSKLVADQQALVNKKIKELQRDVNSGKKSVSFAQKELDAYVTERTNEMNNENKKLVAVFQAKAEQRIKNLKLEKRAEKDFENKLFQQNLKSKRANTGFFLALNIKSYRNLQRKWDKIAEKDIKDFRSQEKQIKKELKKDEKLVAKVEKIKSSDLKGLSDTQKKKFMKIKRFVTKIKKAQIQAELRLRTAKKELKAEGSAIKARITRKPGRTLVTAAITTAAGILTNGLSVGAKAVISKAGVILFTAYGAVQTARLINAKEIIRRGDIIAETAADAAGIFIGAGISSAVNKAVRSVKGIKGVRQTRTTKVKTTVKKAKVTDQIKIGKKGAGRKVFPRQMKLIKTKGGQRVTVARTKGVRGRSEKFSVAEFIKSRKNTGTITTDRGFIRFTKSGRGIKAKFYTKNGRLITTKNFKVIPDNFNLNLFKTKTIIKVRKVKGKKVYEIIQTKKGKIERTEITQLLKDERLLKKILTAEEIKAVKAGKDIITDQRLITKLRAILSKGKIDSFLKGRDIKLTIKQKQLLKVTAADFVTAQKRIVSFNGGKAYIKVTPKQIQYVYQAKVKGNVVYHTVTTSPQGKVIDIKVSVKRPKILRSRLEVFDSRIIEKFNISRIKPLKAIFKGLQNTIKAAGRTLKAKGKKLDDFLIRLMVAKNAGKNFITQTSLLKPTSLKPSSRLITTPRVSTKGGLTNVRLSEVKTPKPLKNLRRDLITQRELIKILNFDSSLNKVAFPAIIGIATLPALVSGTISLAKLDLTKIPLTSTRIRQANLARLKGSTISKTTIKTTLEKTSSKTPTINQIIDTPIPPVLLPPLVPFPALFPGLGTGVRGRKGLFGFPEFLQEKFYFITDLESLILGRKAKPKEIPALLRQGRLFSGTEVRPIISNRRK